MEKKTHFVNGSVHGINSFKYTTFSKEMKNVVVCIREEVTNRLKIGVTNGKKGITLSVESPVYCIDYAEINVLRKVPLRQYFGKEIERTDNASRRTCYGVGSGASTVGADVKTNKNRLMSTNMIEMCNLLSSNSKMFSVNNKHCTSSLSFNHVTVLYYLSKNSSHSIDLNPHCDVVISSKNEYGSKNSQKENSPTVVLSFAAEKSVDFYKRKVLDGKFDSAEHVATMKMKDSEMFVLHPYDERVVERIVKNDGRKKKYAKEENLSQFRHAVSFKSTHSVGSASASTGESTYSVSISVCFRCVNTSEWFHPHRDTVIMQNDSDGKMKLKTEQQMKKQKLIDETRVQLYNKRFQEEMTSELRSFHKSI